MKLGNLVKSYLESTISSIA